MGEERKRLLCGASNGYLTPMNLPPVTPQPSTPPRSFARKLKRAVLVVVAFVMMLTIAAVGLMMVANYGEGYRVGTILKMSKKGVLFKTWEGELTQGFLESTADATSAGVSTRIWYFTVENDDEVISAIDHAIETNKKVKLFYKEKYTLLPWVGDTRQIVYKVEEVQ